MLKRYWQRLRALERETRGQLLDIKEASMRFVGFASGVHTQNTHGCYRATNESGVFTNSNLLKQRQKKGPQMGTPTAEELPRTTCVRRSDRSAN